MSTPAENRPTKLGADLIKEHPALVVSGALVGISIVHIVLVSGVDLSTAKTLMTVADRTQVLLSTVTALTLSSVAVGVFVYIRPLASWYHRQLDRSFPFQLIAVFAGVLVGAVMLAQPVSIWLGVFVGTAAGTAPADAASLLGHSLAVHLSTYVPRSAKGAESAAVAFGQVLSTAL